MRHAIITGLIIFAISSHVFSLPTGILNSEEGWISAGIEYSHNPLNGKGSWGINFEGLDQSRFGIGLTLIMGDRMAISVDGIYYLDLASQGDGNLVIPIKLRAGLFNSSPGIGLSAGLKWFALDISGGEKTSFISLHGAGALDWVNGKLLPALESGLDFDVTLKPTSGYYYYYY
jgi:hypothetical protein